MMEKEVDEDDVSIPSVFLDSETDGDIPSVFLDSEADDNSGSMGSTKRKKGKRKRSDSQKKREVLQRKKLRQIESLKKQNVKKSELVTELKQCMESALPLNQREDQTLFLEEWVGFGGASNLSDLELKLKYATVILVKQDLEKKNGKKISKVSFKKQYSELYFQ